MSEMSPAEEVFFAALERSTPAERAVYLDAACAGQPELRARVEKLLAAHPRVGGFLESQPAGDGTGTFGSPSTADYPGRDETVGAVLAGKYKLIEAIGEGGMGSVYMAQQTEPVKRAVAVKVIKAGMDSKAVLARFEAERQALAMMDHPNIARVLDAGTTENGRPFFVMELVKGVPITQYCDEKKLTPRQRLELFVPVCNAIQHAHQKGIIHRDIKPSNVLVALYDDRPVPKVIDFGVAKAAGQSLTDKTLMTGFGAVVGTPEYMSPEQANLNNLDIDTRSDVYSLGVLLYELLTGSTPVDRKSLGKAALLEVLRIVREVEAPRPSAKLSTINTLPSVAANRGTEPAKLGRSMKGELDWVVLKALEKDRARRYESANGLAGDIQRYLADEIVEARPASAGYRMKKFVRRHKGHVIAASLVLLTLMAGVIGTTIGFFEAKRQTELALEAQRQEAKQREVAEGERDEKEKARQNAVAEQQRADREKAIAEAVRNFVTEDVFGRAGDRSLGQATEIKARVLLEKAAVTVGDKFKDQPEIELAVRHSLTRGFKSIGLNTEACFQAQRGLELCRMLRPPGHFDTLQALDFLGSTNAGNSSKEQKLIWMREAYEGRCRTLGEAHPESLSSAGSLAFLLLGEFRAYTEALQICDKAIEAGAKTHGKNNNSTIGVEAIRARILPHLGRYSECEAILLEQYRFYLKRDGPDSKTAIGSLASVVHMMQENGVFSRAEPLAVDCLERLIRINGQEHADTTYMRSSLGHIYAQLGKRLQAGQMYLDVAHADRLIVGPTSAWARTCQWRGVEHLNAIGKIDLAVGRAEAWAGTDHPDRLANAVSLYGMIAQQTQDKVLAAKSLTRGLELLRRAVARGWSEGTRAAYEFEVYRDRDDFREILADLGRKKPGEHSKVLAGLARSYMLKKEYEKAVKLYLVSIPLQEAEIAKDPKNAGMREELAYQYDHLGDTYQGMRFYQDAEKFHQLGFEQRDRLYKDCNGDQKRKYGDQAAWSIHSVGRDFLGSGQHENAAVKFREAATLRLLIVPGPQTNHLYTLNLLQDYDHEGRAWMAASKVCVHTLAGSSDGRGFFIRSA